MRELGLGGKPSAKKRRTTNSEHSFPRYPNLVEYLEIVRPEQVWVSDITYIHLRQDFVYLAVLMDVFTRGIRGWHLGRGLDWSKRWLDTRQKFTTAIRACSMRPWPIQPVCNKPGCRLVGPKLARPGKTAMPSDSCVPSKRRRLT